MFKNLKKNHFRKNGYAVFCIGAVIGSTLFLSSIEKKNEAIFKNEIRHMISYPPIDGGNTYSKHEVEVNGPGPYVTIKRLFTYQIQSIQTRPNKITVVDDYKNTTNTTWTNLGGTAYPLKNKYASIGVDQILGGTYTNCINELNAMLPYEGCHFELIDMVSPTVNVGANTHYQYYITEESVRYVLTASNTIRTRRFLGNWSNPKVENEERSYEIVFYDYSHNGIVNSL